MLPPFQAILFDFDGTLAVLNLDFAAMRRATLACAEAYQLAPHTFEGMDILELIDHAIALLHTRTPAHAGRFAQEVQALLEAMEVASAQDTRLLPGIAELLEALRGRDIGIGIVTRNCDAAVRVMFPGIDAYCQAFFPRERVRRVKPHPEHLEAALQRLGLTPQQALMVGDGAMDMQAGKRLGMFSVGVLSGSGSRDSLLRHGADLVLASAADLLLHLPQQGGRA